MSNSVKETVRDKMISDLTKSIYMEIIKEAKEHGLNNKYHIYATGCLFASPLIDFNKISNVEEIF